MAANGQFPIEKKITSRLVFFLKKFNGEVTSILDHLVQSRVFSHNGGMYQEIMAQTSDIDRFRKLMELVPKQEMHQRNFLRALTSTDTFTLSREYFLEEFSKPPANSLDMNNVLGG